MLLRPPAEPVADDARDRLEADALALHLVERSTDRSLLEIARLVDDELVEPFPQRIAVVARHHRLRQQVCRLLGVRIKTRVMDLRFLGLGFVDSHGQCPLLSSMDRRPAPQAGRTPRPYCTQAA